MLFAKHNLCNAITSKYSNVEAPCFIGHGNDFREMAAAACSAAAYTATAALQQRHGSAIAWHPRSGAEKGWSSN